MGTPAQRNSVDLISGIPWWPRFFSKVEIENKDDGCWLWQGATMPRAGEDYGRFGLNGKVYYAHRLAYETLVGPIPEGLQIDHLCRVPRCVNVEHLEAVSGVENRRRGTGFSGRQARQTHCIHGHPLSGDNLYEWNGHRFCRTCRRENWNRLYATA